MGLGRLINWIMSPFDAQFIRRSDLSKLGQANEAKRSYERIQRSYERIERSHKHWQTTQLDRLSNIEQAIGALRREICNSGDQESFLRLAALFSPSAVVGRQKKRFGCPGDGGYIMLDDLEDIEAAFSFGIGDDYSWDVAIAEHGVQTIQLDHTVDLPPGTDKNLVFLQRKIVSRANEDGETLAGLVNRYGSGNAASLILKIDIEGDEWPVFEHAERSDLQKFAQIICEFHDFHEANNTAWFERAMRVMHKLAADFEVIHVHGNNAAPFAFVGNVPFPQILEVTFASRARYGFEASDEVYPTELDAPNLNGYPDLFLGRFQF